MNQAVGGYHSLQLKKGILYHENAIYLNTGRNCFEYILLANRFSKVYIPYFTCDVLLEPLLKHKIEYEYYHINEDFEPISLPVLKANEAFLYTNYFGLKSNFVESLATKYQKSLIVDNAQAFYDKPLDGVNTFYSPRKFFGVSDGGILYANTLLDNHFEKDYSFSRMQHLLKRIDISPESGFADYQEVERQLSYQPIMQMSNLTTALLCSIDYDNIKKERRAIFKELMKLFGSINKIKWQLLERMTPLCYPLLLDDGKLIKDKLIKQRIYVPTYWPNVSQISDKSSFEYNLFQNLVNIPCDDIKILESWKK